MYSFHHPELRYHSLIKCLLHEPEVQLLNSSSANLMQVGLAPWSNCLFSHLGVAGSISGYDNLRKLMGNFAVPKCMIGTDQCALYFRHRDEIVEAMIIN